MLASVDRQKLGIGVIAAGILPALLLVDSLVGLVRGWRLVHGQERAIFAAVVGWTLLVIAGVTTARGRGFFVRHWARLVVLCLFLVIAAASIELTVRLIPQTPGLFHLRPPNRQWTFRPTPDVMPGISGDARVTTNADGVRGAPMPDDARVTRILCVGGSTTENLYLDDTETWPRLLEDALRREHIDIWVGSAGSSGRASDAHLRFIEDSPLFDRIDVVVLLVGVNDLGKALMPNGSADDEDAIARPELVGRPLWRRSEAMIRGGVWVRTVIKRLQGNDIDVEDAGGVNYTARRDRRRNAALVESEPNLDAALKAYRGRIERIAEVCERRKIKLILSTQPVLWDASLTESQRRSLWFGWVGDGRYVKIETLRGAMNRYNDVLADIARQKSLPLIDLRSMNARGEFFWDDCHFTEAGAREVARLATPVVESLIGRSTTQEGVTP